jgi:hypothetical protein
MLDMVLLMVCPFPTILKSDNVPVWHSRRLVDAVRQMGGNISFILILLSDVRYEEVPGAGHWFDGVMTSGKISEFFQNLANTYEYPGIPRAITKTFVIANPREMGERGDIKVEQLISWQT